MELANEQKVVLALDAGGTNFVFSAIKSGAEIVEPITLPSNGHDLKLCLNTLFQGFQKIKNQLHEPPVAISFAFPGPADYPNGVIGDLENLPGFRGGVALGPMLEEKFGIPVFINNDGDLFAFGEAISGLLPEINNELQNRGVSRQYRNLLGVTLGTGFGAGIVNNGHLFTGDNSAGAEIWITRNPLAPKTFAEESVSIRAVQRVYAQLTGSVDDKKLSPKEIFDIASGHSVGNAQAARQSFEELGKALGEVLANAITLLDCNVVIGGGLSNAYSLIAPAMMAQINGTIETLEGKTLNRLTVKAFDLENPKECQAFYENNPRIIRLPNSQREVVYNREKQIGIGRSRLGTSKAVAIGAYAYALSQIGS